MEQELSPDMAEFVPIESAEIEPVEPISDVVAVAPEPGPQATARLIEYANGRYIALPPYTTYALVEQPTVDAVPGAARYAYGLLAWQDTRLPLLDINALFHADQAALTDAPRYALIIAYQNVSRGPLVFGAIGLNTLPQTIAIGDDAQCELPGDSKLWPVFALSCFQHEGQAVPILDTSRLFKQGRFFTDAHSAE